MFFLSHLIFELQAIYLYNFLQIFPATPIKSFKVFFIIFISVFAISSTNNLKSMS